MKNTSAQETPMQCPRFQDTNTPLRVLYVAGPGNVIQTYKYWQQGLDDPTQTALTYSSQFFDVMRDLGARGYLLSANDDPQYLADDFITLEHRPVPFRSSTNGILYYLGQIWYGLGIIWTALRFRPNVVVAVEGSTLMFLLTLLPWLGIPVVPLLQCVLWPKYASPSRVQRIILQLSQRLFARDCLASIVVADEIGAQVRELAGSTVQPIIRIFPVYRRERFANLPQPVRKEGEPFRVFFAGRVVPNKGVFDLLAAAKQLAEQGDIDITFDVCGEGFSLAELRTAAAAAGLADRFVCHGHCNQDRMRELQTRSHVAIIPTRTEFVEGFAKAVVEGVMIGRPTIASRVCTDLKYFEGAVMPSSPNNPAAYAEAIARLYNDRELYDRMQQCCARFREDFFDSQRGWGAALRKLLVDSCSDRSCSNQSCDPA